MAIIDLNIPPDTNDMFHSPHNMQQDSGAHEFVGEEFRNSHIDLNTPPFHEINFIPQAQIIFSFSPLEFMQAVQGGFTNNHIDLNAHPFSESENQIIEEEDMRSEDHSNEHLNSQSEEIQQKKIKILSNEERNAIYFALLKKSVNGKLKKTTTTEIAALFSISMRTVQRIWKRSKENMKNGVTDVSHKRTKNCGRKRIEIDWNHFRSISLQERKTIRDATNAIHVSTSVLNRNLRSGDIKRHTNSIKPFLTEENKKRRLQFCLSMLDKESLPHDPKFIDMYNVVHIDEKWFDLSKKCETYYVLADEEEPQRTCKSKNFVGKVMFLAAVARPRFDVEGKVIFSGKVGIYPFITEEPAKRSSVNRVAGTLETKVMTSVNRDTVRSYLIEKVLRDIRAKWPREEMYKIISIQQDNARTHVDPKDVEFCQAAQQDGFDIRLMCQPPNSPDMNVLDLGFFRSLQSLRYKKVAKTIKGLVDAVKETFEEYEVEKLNHIFLTLQLCMRETMKVKGGNNYKLPHMGKQALERQGQLPNQIKCEPSLVNAVYDLLS